MEETKQEAKDVLKLSAKPIDYKKLKTFKPNGDASYESSFFNPENGGIVSVKQADLIENQDWDYHFHKNKKYAAD